MVLLYTKHNRMLQNIFRLMAKKYYKFTVSDMPLITAATISRPHTWKDSEMSYKRPLSQSGTLWIGQAPSFHHTISLSHSHTFYQSIWHADSPFTLLHTRINTFFPSNIHTQTLSFTSSTFPLSLICTRKHSVSNSVIS